MGKAMTKPWFVRRRSALSYRIVPYAWQGWLISAISVGILLVIALPLRVYLTANMTPVNAAIITGGAMLTGIITMIAIMLRFSVSQDALDRRDK